MPAYDPARLETFHRHYAIALAQSVAQDPGRYAWPAEQAPQVAQRFVTTIANGGAGAVSLSGDAAKATLRTLSIKPTYKALEEYLRGA